jgi:hypothetical protein
MTHPRRVARLLPVLVAIVTAAAACSDDGEGGGRSDEEQEYIDAAMATFDPEEAAPMTEDDAECIVTSMVDEIGVDDLEEAGITPESFGEDEEFPSGLSEEQAGEAVDAIDGCIDLRDLFLEAMAEDESVPEEAQECLAEQFDDEVVRRIMVLTLSEGEDAITGDSELMQELTAAFNECPDAVN